MSLVQEMQQSLCHRAWSRARPVRSGGSRRSLALRPARVDGVRRASPSIPELLRAEHGDGAIASPITEGPSGRVAAPTVEDVEGHVELRRGDGSRVRLAQPPEAGAELLVVDGNLAVRAPASGPTASRRHPPDHGTGACGRRHSGSPGGRARRPCRPASARRRQERPNSGLDPKYCHSQLL